MVKCGVFFAVRTDFLNIILTSFDFRELIATHLFASSCFLFLFVTDKLRP
jgi:hypothetical protein